MSNASKSYVPVVQKAGAAIKDLEFAVKSLEATLIATPAEVAKLDGLLGRLGNAINALDRA